MTDILEIMSRDPLSYTKEGGELRIIIQKMRESRKQFLLGNAKAGSTKPPTAKQAEVSKLSLGDLDL